MNNVKIAVNKMVGEYTFIQHNGFYKQNLSQVNKAKLVLHVQSVFDKIGVMISAIQTENKADFKVLADLIKFETWLLSILTLGFDSNHVSAYIEFNCIYVTPTSGYDVMYLSEQDRQDDKIYLCLFNAEY